MHRIPAFVVALLFALVLAPLASIAHDNAHDNAILDGFVAREYQSATGVKLPYRLFAPDSAKRDGELPLILYLHGSGGAGTDNSKQILGGNAQGTHVWIESGAQQRHPAFVLAPQIPETATWHSSSDEPVPYVAALLELLDELRSELRIDARRVYPRREGRHGPGSTLARNGRRAEHSQFVGQIYRVPRRGARRVDPRVCGARLVGVDVRAAENEEQKLCIETMKTRRK